jgi:hypothetical protein
MLTAVGAIGIFLGLYLMVSDRSPCILPPERDADAPGERLHAPYEDAGHLVLDTRLKPILWRRWNGC